MKRQISGWMIGCFLLVGVGCADTIEDRGDEPIEFEEEEQQNNGQAADGPDYCAEFGWYGDGTCDDFCAEPDPDCSGSQPDPDPDPDPDPEPRPEPQPEPEPEPEPTDPICEELAADPEVDWVSKDAEECATFGVWMCDEGKVLFSNECGCGCRPGTEPQPGQCFDDSDPTVNRVGDVDECTLIDFQCEPGWTHFQDDCGCGCLRETCDEDADCPDGYCDPMACDTDDAPCPLACFYPNCDDDTQVLCDALPPDCPPGETAAVRNGCFMCVDARTCEPVNIDG